MREVVPTLPIEPETDILETEYNDQLFAEVVADIADNDVAIEDMPAFYKSRDGRLLAVADWVSEVRPNKPGFPRIEVDSARVDEVLDTLVEAHANNEYPYNRPDVIVPQIPENMPKTLIRDTKAHANFFFNVCYYMRGGIKSVDAVKRMGEMFDEYPELFDNKYVYERLKYDSWDEYENKEFLIEEIASVLSKFGLGFQFATARSWVENAERLHTKYDGDARNIFHGVSDYDTCAERIVNDNKGNGFIGFKYKMASMLAYFLMDEELVDPFIFPIPVDVHVLRVSIANEMITFPDSPHGTNLFNDHTTATLRDIYYNYAERKNVNPLRLCDAVWLLSGALCSSTPGNRTYEPLGRKFRNGRSTVLEPEIVNTKSPLQQRQFARSCGACPVKATCTKNVPIKPYYIAGALYIRSEKEQFPEPPVQGSLF